MGYYIRSLPKKKKLPKWKVQFVSYKNCHLPKKRKPTKRRTWDIAKERWRTLGFHTGMEFADAKTRSRQLNAQLLLKQQEERIRKLQRNDEEFRSKSHTVLPREFVEEFEKHFIRARPNPSLQERRRLNRIRLVWKAAQKMILMIQIEPSEWFFHLNDIYDYFQTQQLSLYYMQSILKIANFWGFFISRKLAKPFLPVPPPRGYERQRLLDAFYSKKKHRKPSLPLTPERLSEAKEKMNKGNFNWLLISVWFGLRPQEIENLHNRSLWAVETAGNGRKILRVFQTKIVALPPEDRWKPIPILFTEQEFILKTIQDGNFKKPLWKTMRAHFGNGTGLYSGRKGFTDLMLSKGHSLENISIWMGHSSLDRTWRSYKNKRLFQIR